MKLSRRTIVNIIVFILFMGLSFVLLLSPWFYFKYHAPITDEENEAIVCRNESVEGHQSSDVRSIAAGKMKDGDKVMLYGKVSYAPASEMFYLRDGIHSLPLSLRDCRNIDPLKNEGVPVYVIGTVADVDGQPTIVADGLTMDYPVWVRNVFNAGVYAYLIVIGYAVAGLMMLIMKFFAFIGFSRAKKEKLTPEERNAQGAGRSILAGISSPFMWPLNPILGAGLHLNGIVAGIIGLRSKKRTVAIVGLTLCAAGLIVTPLVLGAFGAFSKAGSPDFLGYFVESSFRDPEEVEEDMGPPEPLESEPYVNEKLGFSMRLPRGWKIDESGQYAPVLFHAPTNDIDSKGKNFAANILVFGGPAEKDTPETVMAAVKANADKGKGYVKNEDGLLRDGDRTIGIILGYTYPDEEVGPLQLFYFVTGKDPIYFFTVTTVASTWSTYEKVVKDSFATFESVPVKPVE